MSDAVSRAAREVESAMDRWYEDLPRYKAGLPARGNLGAALVILDRLKTNYRLQLRDHRAAGGGQLQGLGGPAAANVLAQFGEERPFIREGGRTNRGTPASIEALLDALAATGLGALEENDRNALLRDVAQRFVVDRIQEYFTRERVTFDYASNKTTSHLIAHILERARADGKHGDVAQHLVGAKLQLRFPDERIANESVSTADLSTGRAGDFEVGSTAFHVTVAPQFGVIKRCQQNVASGLRPYLVVPLGKLAAAQELVEQELPGQATVTTIEAFVGQNLDELGQFTPDGARDQLIALLLVYNDRVDRVETDKSLLIELPSALARHSDRVRAALNR